MTADEGAIPLTLRAGVRETTFRRLSQIDRLLLADLLRLAALVFVPLAALATLVFAFIYHVTLSADREVLAAGQEQAVQVGRATVNSTLNQMAGDISYLAEEETLSNWLHTGDPAVLNTVAEQYLAFVVHKREYDKLRFIDVDGTERVRADRVGGRPHIVATGSLQNKSGRYFFLDSVGLERGEIYVSPFDLNVENDAIEQPIKPTIRAATPVFDSTGTKRGVIVLNYLGDRLLEEIRSLANPSAGSIWLVNSEGFWLSGPHRDDEWGFLIPARAERSFNNAFPSAWQRIMDAPGFGQFADGDGLFSYAPLFAPATAEDGVNIVTAPVWYLIAYLPASATGTQLAGFVTNLGFALILLLGASLLIGYYGARRRQAEIEIRSLNERLAGDNQALQMLNQELEAFSYSVSHDLRTPLRAIDGFSKALLEDCSEALGDSGREHLGRVRNAAQRMSELIDDLIRLAQVSRADLSVVDDVDLTEIAGSVVDNLRRIEPDRDVEFQTEPEILARCDPRLLRIVLENLLANAWKFTADRRPAIVEFGRAGGEAQNVYFVRDNGIGFDMAHAGKLFGAFQRLHPSDEFPGTGIGLATVARIVKKHGGRAWAEAKPNRGATLYFTLWGEGR